MHISPQTIILVSFGALITAIALVTALPHRVGRFDTTRPGEITVPLGVPTPTSLNWPVVSTDSNNLQATSSVKETAPASLKTYGAVVQEFDALGRRVQFSFDQQGTCLVRPNRFVTKQETVLMFDNRSDRKIFVILDGVTYPIAAFQYHIAQVVFSGGLGSYPLHCNTQFNAATVLVQP